MVYNVSSCFSFQFLVSFLFLIVAQVELGLRTFKFYKSDKSSNMLQVGQIKHCNQFPWGLLYLLVCTFFLLGMRLSLEQKKSKNQRLLLF